MALPIWAYYMKKVYRDTRLPYRPDATFDVPADFNPCEKDDGGTGDFGIDDVYE